MVPLSTSSLYDAKIPDLFKIIDYYSSEDDYFNFDKISNDLFNELKEYHNAKHIVSYSSGFWALVQVIKAKSIDGKNDVIIPSLTYRRLADVISWANKTPKFIDVDENTLTPNVEMLEDAIDENTSLIFGVHPIVNCCDVEGYIKLASKKNIPIIFDAVESVHETFNNKRIGSFDVGEVFSLHASKLINGAEGGYVCTSDDELFKKLNDQKITQSKYYNFLEFNPLNSVHAINSLRKIDELVQHNKQIYKEYEKLLINHQFLSLLKFDENEKTSYKNIVVRLNDNSPIGRDKIISELNKIQIFARAYYSPALHDKIYKYKVKNACLEITNKIKGKFFNLPCGFRTALDDVRRVVNEINSILTRG